MKDEMVDVTDRAGYVPMQIPGWRVSISTQIWDRYVKVPEWVENESESTRLSDILTLLWSTLRATTPPKSGLWYGFGFAMGVYPNDANAVTDDGTAVPAVILLEVFAAIDTDRMPRLVVRLERESLPDFARGGEVQH